MHCFKDHFKNILLDFTEDFLYVNYNKANRKGLDSKVIH